MSRKKFAFIGSGSVVFTRNLVRDILTFPAFEDCEIALMDINPDNLELSRRAAERIVAAGNYPATVTATTDRVEALKDADGVLITIQVGGFEAAVADVAIPKEYGISMNVGDTRGPSGNIPVLKNPSGHVDILKDIERYCPDAIVLNIPTPWPCSAGQQRIRSNHKRPMP